MSERVAAPDGDDASEKRSDCTPRTFLDFAVEEIFQRAAQAETRTVASFAGGRLAAPAASNIEILSGHDWGILLGALANAGYFPPRYFMDLLTSALAESLTQAEALSPKELVDILVAFGTLDHEPDESWPGFLDLAIGKLCATCELQQSIEVRDVAKLLRVLAVFGTCRGNQGGEPRIKGSCGSSSALRSGFERLYKIGVSFLLARDSGKLDLGNSGELSSMDMLSIWEAHLERRSAGTSGLLDPASSDQARAGRGDDEWEEHDKLLSLAYRARSENIMPLTYAPSQLRFGDRLSDLLREDASESSGREVDFRPQHVVEECALEVYIALPERKIAVEYQGPRRYNQVTGARRMDTTAKLFQLSCSGWCVIEVCYQEVAFSMTRAGLEDTDSFLRTQIIPYVRARRPRQVLCLPEPMAAPATARILGGDGG